MDKSDYERAIVALERLIAQNAPEAAYQELFETAPVILDAIGYIESIPQPRLPLEVKGAFIPDFIARMSTGDWEILDLKTPGAKLLLGRERREAFTAQMNAYIGQMDDYADWFNDAANREFFRTRYGQSVPERPRTLLVAGRSADLDQAELHRQLRRREGVRIITFDAVLNELERRHTQLFGSVEHQRGLTVALVARIRAVRRSITTTIWRLGHPGLTTAIRLVVEPDDRLVLSVNPTKGPGVRVEARPGAFSPDQWTLIMAELGFASGRYVLRIRVDDEEVVSTQLRTAEVLLLAGDGAALGDDSPTSRPIDLVEYMAWAQVLDFRSRLQYTSDVAAWIKSSAPTSVDFSNGRHLTSDE